MQHGHAKACTICTKQYSILCSMPNPQLQPGFAVYSLDPRPRSQSTLRRAWLMLAGATVSPPREGSFMLPLSPYEYARPFAHCPQHSMHLLGLLVACFVVQAGLAQDGLWGLGGLLDLALLARSAHASCCQALHLSGVPTSGSAVGMLLLFACRYCPLHASGGVFYSGSQPPDHNSSDTPKLHLKEYTHPARGAAACSRA